MGGRNAQYRLSFIVDNGDLGISLQQGLQYRFSTLGGGKENSRLSKGKFALGIGINVAAHDIE